MTSTAGRSELAPVRDAPLPRRWAAVALTIAAVLVTAAFCVPPLANVDVHFDPDGVAPISGSWQPRVGPGTVPAVLLGLAAVRWAASVARAARWRVLLPVSYVAALAWLLALAGVDGRAGIAGILGRGDEYLPSARAIHDVPRMLRDFITRIPFTDAPHNWSVNVAGHPPGALLFFVTLVRVGLGGELAAGLTVVVIAASTPLAVILTLRRLGAATAARQVAPFLVFGPAAIWSAVSADAVFAATAAWGTCLLACAVTASRNRVVGWALGAGLVLGLCLFLSYGLVLFGLIALAVPVAARRWVPVLWASGAAAAVVATFAVLGFPWWTAYPVLTSRYWHGIARLRPGYYWTFADLALLVLCAGPVAAVGLAAVAHRIRIRSIGDANRVVVALVLAAAAALAIADVSQLSRAEVERIWLPFVPWLLVGVALVPSRLRAPMFGVQIATAIVIQSLFLTLW